MQFCNSVLRNRLAHHIRRLTIIGDTFINSFSPALRDAMTRLVDVMASADTLEHLAISPSADLLFREEPAILDNLLIRPPSRSLELMYVAVSDWLKKHRFVGLRDISLGFNFSSNVLDLLSITAGSAATLESMHLDVDCMLASINFREGCMPYSKLRMLSIAGAIDLRLTGLCAAFPNVEFIRWDNVDASMNGIMLSGPATNVFHPLSKLIGLEGDVECMALLGPHHDLRVACVTNRIDTLSLFSQLTPSIAGDASRSLSLFVRLRDPEVDSWEDGSSGFAADHLFAEICRIAPRLRFLSLRISVVLEPLEDERIGHYSARQQKTMEKISAIASPNLGGLEDLRCFYLKFVPRSPLSRTAGVWIGFAEHFLSNLPRVRFFVLDLSEDWICLSRPKTPVRYADDVAAFVELKLDAEDIDRLLEQYQFEGPDWRLDGVADWLRSVESLGNV